MRQEGNFIVMIQEGLIPSHGSKGLHEMDAIYLEYKAVRKKSLRESSERKFVCCFSTDWQLYVPLSS